MSRTIGRSVLLAVCCLAAGLTVARAADDDWKPLFNGKDLSGWKAVDGPKEAWHVEDGMLYCKGGGGGWLATEAEYANFELELEFRLPENGNSGVFLRSPLSGDPAYTGMEIQVLDDGGSDYKTLQPWQYCGSLYGVVAAKKGASKPAGEWQKYLIKCDKQHLTITLNGTQIIDTKLDEHKEQEASHPGLKRTTGHIGLQNHGTRLDYRNLRIRTLPD